MSKGHGETSSYSRNVGLDLRQAYGTIGNANGKIEYVGYCYPGAKDSEEKFQIFKLAYDSNGRITHRRWAKKSNEVGNNDEFNKEWDEKGNYEYSGI